MTRKKPERKKPERNRPERNEVGLRFSVIDHGARQAALQPWIAMECYQLSPGNRVGRLDSLDLTDQQVVREYQQVAVQKLGVTPDNLCTLSFCTRDAAFRFSEHDAGPTDTIFFMSQQTEFDLYVPAGVQTTYVSLDQDAFLKAARRLNPRDWDDAPQGVALLQSRRKPMFRQAVEAWFAAAGRAAGSQHLLDAGLMRRLIFQTMVQIAATPQDSVEPVPAALRVRALRICNRARAFAEDRCEADDPPSVAALCAAAGVSERTLQYAFRSHVKMSPLAYLRLLRLNRVRAVLTAASPHDTSVTATAMQHGFLHLGRFAQDYRRVFDERPSATLGS